MIHLKIVGKNLSLDRVTPDDLEFICRLECSKDIWFYEEIIESDYNIVREKYMEKMNSQHSYDFIVKKSSEEESIPIGLAQIWSYVEYRKSWEIGFAISPNYQGHGYGYEATNLLLEFAFNRLEAHKVIGMCNSNNEKSVKLMESLNMRREGTFKEELYWKNKWVDQYFYAILEKEFYNM